MIKYLIIILLFVSCSENKINNKVSNTTNKTIPEEHNSIHKQEWEKNREYKSNNIDENSFYINIEEIKELTNSNIGNFRNPKFISGGEKVIFTNANFNEIWFANLITNQIEKIIAFPNCGYKYQISVKGDKIYFRVKEPKNEKVNTRYTIFEYDLVAKKLIELYKSSNRISSPVLIDDYLFFRVDEKPICISTLSKNQVNDFPEPYFFIKNNKLLRKLQNITTIESNEKFVDCDYSNDRKNIFALSSNNGIYIFNLAGKLINQFPDAKSLTKLSGSNLILFTVEKDQGNKIVSSKIFMGFLNSSRVTEIKFDKSELIFNPDWSPSDNKIVYSNDNGIIKLLSFNIEKK